MPVRMTLSVPANATARRPISVRWMCTAQVRTVEGPFKRGRGRPRKVPEFAVAFKHYPVTYTTTAVTNEVSELACQALGSQLANLTPVIENRP